MKLIIPMNTRKIELHMTPKEFAAFRMILIAFKSVISKTSMTKKSWAKELAFVSELMKVSDD